MNDEMDFYLSRCVKNWAAQYHSPSYGRRRLLQAAASPPVQRERQIVRFLAGLKSWLIGSNEQEFYIEGDWVIGPVTQSRAWSYHVVASGAWPSRTFLHA
jgi:hypothetical protein